MKAKELSEMSLEELWQLFPIVLSEHKKYWLEWFKEESDFLKNKLEKVNVYRISHIGSTAIESIWAKPTIDILIELVNKQEMNEVKNRLLDCGYLCMSEKNGQIALNKGYTKQGYADRVFHIHIRIVGDNDELYFRDYMNEHKALAKEYEQLKLSLWKLYEHDRDGYTNAKTDFIKKHTEKAKELYANKYEVS